MKYKLIEKFIKDNKDREITKHEGNFSSLVWGTSCLLIYSPLKKKYFRGDFGSLALLLGGKRGIGFFNNNQYTASTKQALEKYLKNRKKFTELADFKKIDQDFNHIYRQYYPSRLKMLNLRELEQLIINTFEKLRDWQVITLFSEALDEHIVKEYFDRMKTKINFQKFMHLSQLTDFTPFVYKSQAGLIDFNKSKNKENQWVFANYLYTPKLKDCLKLARQNLQELGGLQRIKNEENKLQKQIRQNKILVEKYRRTLTKKTRDLFDYIKIAIYIRDVRKESVYKLNAVLSNAIREMFLRLDLPEKNIIYTMYKDFVTKHYKQKKFKAELTRRKKGFIIFFGKKGPEIEYADFEKAKNNIYKEIFNLSGKISEIKGNVANRGHVKGTVKIVLSAKDFSKFKQGEILVTSMTRPEFVPLLKKAIGIITDEGGITCHAAIVSRELNIPCIIGTKMATKALKDGQQVEIDANNGIIKIIL
ncbi:MAG: PEP-utilizing enzyme [Patescibacteria group bacterium]